jgi:hypothetical protein
MTETSTTGTVLLVLSWLLAAGMLLTVVQAAGRRAGGPKSTVFKMFGLLVVWTAAAIGIASTGLMMEGTGRETRPKVIGNHLRMAARAGQKRSLRLHRCGPNRGETRRALAGCRGQPAFADRSL